MKDFKTHIVKKGDTLYRIALKYHTTVKQLIELNHLHNTLLKEGQILIIGSNTLAENENDLSYETFLNTHIGKGLLKIQVLIGSTFYPIQDTKIEVSKTFQGNKKIFFNGYTDENGQMDEIILPAPIRRQDYLNGAATYQIEATHPFYKTVVIDQVLIYDGIKSLQKIEMLPVAYLLGKEQENEK